MWMYVECFYVFVIKVKMEYLGGMYLSIDDLKCFLCYIINNGEKLILIGGESYKIG